MRYRYPCRKQIEKHFKAWAKLKKKTQLKKLSQPELTHQTHDLSHETVMNSYNKK